MEKTLVSSISRRSIIKSATAGVAILSLSQSLSAQESTPEADEWTFTDDKGVTVTLPSRPKRVAMDVNAAAPLWDFGIEPTALFGWNVLADGNLTNAGGRIDPGEILIVGDVNEPLRFEDLVAIEPDLIVTLTWTPDEPTDYWSINAEVLELVQGIAPIVAISATGRADDNTLRFAELAEALGADLSSPELAQSRSDFDAALARVPAVAEENADLTVLFGFVGADGAVIANPTDWADLNMYLELGVNIIQPEAEAGSFWEEISAEQALKYPADLLFVSIRNGEHLVDEVKTYPTWAQHPAVSANQVYGWNQDFIMSYQGMAEALNVVADALAGSEKVSE